MKNFGSWVVVFLCSAMAAGCAQKEARVSPPEPNRPPVAGPIPAAPPDVRTMEAEAAYRACLVRAARYVDTQVGDAGDVAQVIAPMCYPQFRDFEAAADAGLPERDRYAFDYAGDRRQIALAGDAIRIERNQAAATEATGEAQEPPAAHRY